MRIFKLGANTDCLQNNRVPSTDTFQVVDESPPARVLEDLSENRFTRQRCEVGHCSRIYSNKGGLHGIVRISQTIGVFRC